MKIEKGIPVPKSGRRGPASKYPFGEMEVGDSVFFDVAVCGGSSNEQMAAHKYGRRTGKKFKTARVNDGEKYGVRIWRVE